MDALTMLANTTTSPADLLELVVRDFPQIEFTEAKQFSWHAGKRSISYRQFNPNDTRAAWALLHELGHALLDHTDFKSDFELLQLEVSAWVKAHMLAKKYGIDIDQGYIEDCTDSYRDWLHLRSTCPNCYERCLQTDRHTYRCPNCHTSWQVTRSRLCRPYRRRK